MSKKKPLATETLRENSRAIETERLRLRMLHLSDLDDLAALFADPDVMRYVGNGKPVDGAEAKKAIASIVAHWERHGFGRWAVEDKTTREFVGYGGLRSLFGMPEVVYHLAKAHWGKGLATELAMASLRYGFDAHRFARIVAIAKPPNAASIHVMEKIGMHFEMRTSYYEMEVVQYAISASEFEALNRRGDQGGGVVSI
jgi:[ribosomal protein S5]-alanine N-acetyltransferase